MSLALEYRFVELGFYDLDDDRCITALRSSTVPREDEAVNIRGITYDVQRVTWAVDHSDKGRDFRSLRADIYLQRRSK